MMLSPNLQRLFLFLLTRKRGDRLPIALILEITGWKLKSLNTRLSKGHFASYFARDENDQDTLVILRNGSDLSEEKFWRSTTQVMPRQEDSSVAAYDLGLEAIAQPLHAQNVKGVALPQFAGLDYLMKEHGSSSSGHNFTSVEVRVSVRAQTTFERPRQ